MNREQTEFCHFSTTEGQPFHTYRNSKELIFSPQSNKKIVLMRNKFSRGCSFLELFCFKQKIKELWHEISKHVVFSKT
jgi:hypothetical protein